MNTVEELNSISRKSEYIKSYDGRELYLERYWIERPPTQKILVLHGVCGDTHAVLPLIFEILKKNPRIECITYDLRGHGYSTREIPDENNLETVHAKDLLEIIKSLDDLVHLVGHSYGGLIIQKLLEISPHFPHKKLFFVSIFHTIPAFSLSRNFWFNQLKKKKQHKIKPKRTVNQYLKYKDCHDFSFRRIFSDVSFFGPKHYILLYGSIFGLKSIRPEVINLPESHLLYGELDLIFNKKQTQRWLQGLNRVKSHPFISNHNMLINIPDKIAELIVGCIEGK